MKTMKTVKKFILAAVVLPIGMGAASAYAFGGQDHHKNQQNRSKMGFDRHIMHKLDLTDIQKEQLKSLRKADKAEMKAKFKENAKTLQAKRQVFRQKINELLLADTFDSAKATVLIKEMSDMKIKHQVAMLEKQHKMLSVLTPKQKTKFMELQKQRAEKQTKKMQHRIDRHNK